MSNFHTSVMLESMMRMSNSHLRKMLDGLGCVGINVAMDANE